MSTCAAEQAQIMFDIANDDVTGRYWTGLEKLRSAFSYGEPLGKLLDWRNGRQMAFRKRID